MPAYKLKILDSNSLRAFRFLKSAIHLTLSQENLQRIADYYQNRFITRRTLNFAFALGTVSWRRIKTGKGGLVSV